MYKPTAALLAVAIGAWVPLMGAEKPVGVTPATMTRIGTVDSRFQSFNVEMVEVTGGRFWAPYKAAKTAPPAAQPSGSPSVPGLDPSAFRQRTPLDLTSPRLRKLAAALGPAYVRVSGTWANSTFFQDSAGPALTTPPAGFGGVLTSAQWRGVIDFSKAVDARIITSFAISDGVRDSNGIWTPDQAAKFLAFTKAAGGTIAAAEFFNEPSFPTLGGAPKGYNAAAYGRDFTIFKKFVKQAAPDMVILGPGSVGEAAPLGAMSIMKTEDMINAGGGGVDAFSYHFYGGVSKRCGGLGGSPQSTPETALSEEWLSRTDRDAAFYASLRDRFEPGKPLWLTETGETACGGNPWASTFTDSFRYLNQLGSLAKRGVQVVAHNTLSASDYALIDEETLTPRPNYWSALLWRRVMGTTVLDPGVSPSPDLHLYAHCLANHPGGVALLAINADRTAEHELEVPTASDRYTLTSQDLLSPTVQLNGKELKVSSTDVIADLKGKSTRAGKVSFAPASITFLAMPKAGNPACR